MTTNCKEPEHVLTDEQAKALILTILKDRIVSPDTSARELINIYSLLELQKPTQATAVDIPPETAITMSPLSKLVIGVKDELKDELIDADETKGSTVVIAKGVARIGYVIKKCKKEGVVDKVIKGEIGKRFQHYNLQDFDTIKLSKFPKMYPTKYPDPDPTTDTVEVDDGLPVIDFDDETPF